MTVLVAQNLPDKIILTADSGWFIGKTKLNKGSKIRELNNQVFSSTGWISEIDMFECFCMTRKPENNTQLAIVRFFSDFRKYLADTYGKSDTQIDNTYFYVYDKLLYHYNSAVRAIPENDYFTDGAGFCEANMCMHLGYSPKEAVKKTIELNIYASGDVQEIIINKK